MLVALDDARERVAARSSVARTEDTAAAIAGSLGTEGGVQVYQRHVDELVKQADPSATYTKESTLPPPPPDAIRV